MDFSPTPRQFDFKEENRFRIKRERQSQRKCTQDKITNFPFNIYDKHAHCSMLVNI